MKIVIAGSGSVGFHLAELLTKENQDIILIDTDEDVLLHASTHLDVLTIKGDITSVGILKNANVEKANLFIAVTTSETTNLLSAILAKQLGAKTTIARVDNPEYLAKEQKEKFLNLGVDKLISPQRLAAQEIERLLRRSSFTDVFEFEDGKIAIVGFTIDNSSSIMGKSMNQMDMLTPDFDFRGIALLRNHRTLIPKGDTILRQGDHLYVAAQKHCVDKVSRFAGKQLKPVKKVMIIGDTPLAYRTAQLLENKYRVSFIVKNKERAKRFIESLSNALVSVADYGNIELLQEEGLHDMDAFIALTKNSETNIITSLMAEEGGVYKTIAAVDNTIYTHISQNIGIDTMINKKLIAANNIFRFVRKGTIKAIASLHGVDAELIEFEILRSNRITSHAIRELHLPEKSIIAGVVRGEESFIPNGDFQLQLKDKIIVFAQPEAIHKVEEIFK